MTTTISKWIGKLVLGFIAAIDVYLVDRVKSPVAKRSIRSLLNPLKSITNALSDDNPKNDEQVEAIVKLYINQEVPVFASGEIAAALDKIQDENVKAVLNTVAEPVLEMVRLISDDNPNNGAQLKELVDTFVKSKNTQDIAVIHILLPLVEEKVPDGPFKDVLLTIIKDVLLGNKKMEA